MPDFLHTSKETGVTSTDNVVNYLNGVSDDEWEAKVKTIIDQNGIVSFYFEHTNRSNHSHPSANVDLKDWSGKQRTILIKSMKPTPASNKQMSFIYSD